MLEDKHKKFVKLLSELQRAGIGMGVEEMKTEGFRDYPIFFYDYDKRLAGIAIFNGIKDYGRGERVRKKNVYAYYYHKDLNPHLVTTESSTANDSQLFFNIKKEVYEKIKKQISCFGCWDDKSEEETGFFLDTVLDYFETQSGTQDTEIKKQITEIKKQIKIVKIVSHFLQQSQEGPAELGGLKPETFLAAQKTLEKTLENMLLEKGIDKPKDARGARELIMLAENYQVNTERARKLLIEKISKYQKRELEEIKIKKNNVREVEKIKEDLKQ